MFPTFVNQNHSVSLENYGLVQDQCNRVLASLDKAIEKRRSDLGLSFSFLPASSPCNNAFFLRSDKTFLFFTPLPPSSPLRSFILDGNSIPNFSEAAAWNIVVHQFGFIKPQMFHGPVLSDFADENQSSRIYEELAEQYITASLVEANRLRAFLGFETLQEPLDELLRDYPDFNRNVFVGMRFDDGHQFTELWNVIQATLKEFGLTALRADMKTYPMDSDLWSNICVYMMGCRFGVFVFEEIDERSFNPNIPLEYGFMRAMSRQMLLLKDKRMPRLPTDVVGKIYKDFDTYNIKASVEARVRRWCQSDLNLINRN